MPITIVIGSQWGDEGKGRITDMLAAEAVLVARFNGGDNAGHTVTVGDQIFKLHLVPSGIVQPNALAVMGSGMVINPKKLLDEMDYLMDSGIEVDPQRLGISAGAHLILPSHIAIDGAAEIARGDGAIGTTKRGIGPAYADRTAREGLRVGDMLASDFRQRVIRRILDQNKGIVALYNLPPLDATEIANRYEQYAERMRPFITDVSEQVHQVLKRGGRVLAEGAQGTLLDIDHGTYPFVTSSNPISGGVITSLGVGPHTVDRVIGVSKAFQSRVGEGPMPTELSGEPAVALRGTGENPWDEFGTTTRRPRRCGWLDLVLLRYAARINGFTEMMITKLDVLSGIEPLKTCAAYRYQGQTWNDMPFGPDALSKVEPIYDEHPGWHEPIMSARNREHLPGPALEYLQTISTAVNVPISYASVGPERDQIVHFKSTI
ncbi:MAG: adenylosuccinate synthase [Chloroflexota bacterium]